MPHEFWDGKYAGDQYHYGTEPSAFVVAQASHLRPGGRVLCAGDGEGRNGVWLAGRGLDVTTIDPSTAGTRKARALAAGRGVSMEVIEAALPRYRLEPKSYDAAVLVFLHLRPEDRVGAHRSIARSLRPGGVLLLQGFTPRQLENTSGGPKDPDRLFTAEMLARDFAEMEIELLVEASVDLDEGPGHQGHADVVMLRARQPGPR